MFADILIYLFVFILGLCAGSFLNCVIYRLEKEKKMTTRSYCPKCKKQLEWRDLVPVLSFFILKGKCRSCKKPISWQYPIVEISTAAIFLLIFNFQFSIFNFENIASLIFYWAINCFLIIIFVYDLKHYLIPDKVLFPAIIIALIYDLFAINYLLAAAVASGFFLVIFLISKGCWMGFGDVKLAVLMGLLLGLPNVLAALFLAFFFGAIIGLILMVFDKKNLKSEIPFGPFLIAGTFIAMLWGPQIIQWYSRLFSN